MTASACFTILSLLRPGGPDSLYGVVRDAVTGTPLAAVQVGTQAGVSGATTTSQGAYSVSAPAGPQLLSFAREGYDTLRLSVNVSPGFSLHLDVELDPLPVSLPALTVARVIQGPAGALAPATSDSFELGLHRFTRDGLSSNPLVAADDPMLAAAVLSSPSSQVGFPTTLRVHGGSGDQNLLLLDGLPVYGTMHLGGAAGLINPDAVSAVELHSAVPPPAYSGRLSSVIDVQLLPSTSAGATRFVGAWDPIAVRQLVEGQYAGGAGSFLVSGRQSYRGVFAQDGDGLTTNGFHDLLAHTSLRSGGEEIRLDLLRDGDQLTFPARVDSLQQDTEHGLSQRQNRFSWTSTTAGAVWSHRYDGGSLTTRLWTASSGGDISWTPTGRSDVLLSQLQERGISSELFRGHQTSEQRYGISIQHTDTRYQLTSSSGRPVRLTSAPTLVGIYGDDRRRLGPLALFTGLRVNRAGRAALSLEPRLSLRYHASAETSISLGLARIHQYVQSLRNEESLLDHAFGADLLIGVGAGGLRPARSDQVSLELATRLGRSVHLSIDGYLRRFSGLIIPAALSSAPFSPGLPQTASGNSGAAGLHLHYHASRDDASLELGWEATDRTLGAAEFSPASLRSWWGSLGLGRRLDPSTAVRLSGMLTHGAPTSVVDSPVDWESPGRLAGSGEISGSPQDIVGLLDAAMQPMYFRADVGLTRHWLVNIAHRAATLTGSITITNITNHANVLGYVQDGSARRALLFPARSLEARLGWSF